MKIIVTGSLTSGFGGMETVFKKFNYLLKEDFSIRFITIDKRRDHVNDTNWTRGINFTIVRTLHSFRLLKMYSYIRQFKKIINNDKPCVIICYDYFGYRIVKSALKKTKHQCKIISWCHFSFDCFREKEKIYISNADYHLSICNEIKSQMIEYGIDPDTIDTVYNPISPQQAIIPRNNADVNFINFLYVGRVQYAEQKNMQEMFHAIAQLDYPYKLDIVGDGKSEDVENLKELSVKLDISDKIEWHGWQNKPWNYVINNISNVDALLLSSSYEGLGMVLLEAISYGLFCISSNCKTGPKEIINKENGLMYEVGNIEDFTEKLNMLKHLSRSSADIIKNTIERFYDDQYKIRIKDLIKNKYIQKE